MKKYNIFNFKFGKIKRNLSYYVKAGFLLNLSINALDLIPGVSEKLAFNSIDRVQQFFGVDALNDYIVKDETYLGYRIERILDDAIASAIKKNG
jgi:hypothetical protein